MRERLRERPTSKSSGAGMPPANEMSSARSVSARMSRTGEDCTAPMRSDGGGGGRRGMAEKDAMRRRARSSPLCAPRRDPHALLPASAGDAQRAMAHELA